MSENRIYSFDIFDTCFVRACGSPYNVFDLLAYRILGEESEESLRMDFAAIRIEGERKARLHPGKKEVTLTDIYDCCSFEGLTSMDKQQIAVAEMEIEREQLIPVYSILQKIKELHKMGESVYYISDMYLPQEFIHELLDEHGFWQSGDKLYVSCVSRNTKRDGTLFKQIAEENAIAYRYWHHWGDNRHSDYRVPKRFGIKAHLVNHKYAYYERYLLKQDYFPGFFVSVSLQNVLVGLLIFVGIFFAGRSGFVGCLIGCLGFLYYKNSKQISKITILLKTAFIVLLCIVMLLSVLHLCFPDYYLLLTEQVFPYAFEFLYSFEESGSMETASTNQLGDMWNSDFNLYELIWGSGKYSNPDGSYYMHVDPGILRHLLFMGILGYVVLIIYQLSVIPFWKMYEKERFYSLLIFLFIFIMDFKGVTVGINKFMFAIPLLLSFTYLFLPRSQNSV